MRTICLAALVLLVGALAEVPAMAQTPADLEAQFGIVPVLQRVVQLPPNDIRRLTIRDVAAGSKISVRFESLSPNRPVQVEILQRMNGHGGRNAYRSLQAHGPAEKGYFTVPTPEAGAYLVTLRQPQGARHPINVGMQVLLEQSSIAGSAQGVRTLPVQIRIAVAVFSLGFLWTAILLCGVPVIRAFRRRRTPPPQLWYG